MEQDKPHVLIACDYPDSVYDVNSTAIINGLKGRYYFTKIYTCDLPIIDHRSFDLVYCMWWRSDFLDRNFIPRDKLCIQVASFWSWQRNFPTPLEELVEKYLLRAGAVSVNCYGLWEVISPLHPHVFLNRGGVDLELFKPCPPRSTDKPLVVGWTGSVTTHGNNKGYYDIILPACSAVTDVMLNTRTKEERVFAHKDMPQFYSEIDVYVCASESEGTPCPVLEAAASARAVISTPVGIVPDLIQDWDNGLVIGRSVEDLTRAIVQLRDDRQLCLKMGQRNREKVISDGWSWKERAQAYGYMFDMMLAL